MRRDKQYGRCTLAAGLGRIIRCSVARRLPLQVHRPLREQQQQRQRPRSLVSASLTVSNSTYLLCTELCTYIAVVVTERFLIGQLDTGDLIAATVHVLYLYMLAE